MNRTEQLHHSLLRALEIEVEEYKIETEPEPETEEDHHRHGRRLKAAVRVEKRSFPKAFSGRTHCTTITNITLT